MESLIFILLLLVRCGVAVGQMRQYIFITSPLGWYDAQTYCRQNYRDLATVTSLDEYNQLLQLEISSSGSWTGLSRTSGNWTWSDGEPLSFPNWFGDPTFFQPTKFNCAVMSSTQPGFSINFNCNSKRKFFCYQCPILVQKKMTWEEAQKYCKTNYNGLASGTSNSCLQQQNLETKSMWIGLRFINGIWFWVSGEQLGSLVSMPSCPALPYRCGSLNTMTNTLENQNCNDRLNFYCYST